MTTNIGNTYLHDLYGVEFTPLYGEIEATLAQMDGDRDPLSGPDDAVQVNWNQVAMQAEKLLEQCYDLRVALWLMRAQLHQEGITALWSTLAQLSHRLSDTPEVTYPRSLEGEDYSDHAAALGWLSTSQCIAELKLSRLTKEHNYHLQDLYNTETAFSDERSFASLTAMLLVVNSYYQQHGLPDLKEQLTDACRSLERIEKHANQYSSGYQLECQMLHTFISKCISQIDMLCPMTEGEQEGIRNNAENNSIFITGNDDVNIRSRQEVILMLDRILDYFQRHEPSHPVPIFIRRCKQMIGMDFVSIVEELLPESMNTLQQYTGKE
ncbi:ImpA family type VI secretion system protein [Enterobacteriaceae bacterium 4M9]|nr:ImpA family type VI secretion system protein [Enterobacteriaceae bacterium 4M9]